MYVSLAAQFEKYALSSSDLQIYVYNCLLILISFILAFSCIVGNQVKDNRVRNKIKRGRKEETECMLAGI